MTQQAIFILAGALVLFSGCAARQAQTEQTTRVPVEQELPFSPGEVICLESKTAIDAGTFQATIDSEGNVLLPFGLKIHVGGLTTAEATVAVRKTYQPKYFKNWYYEVIRVQPKHPADGSQPSRSVTNSTPLAAGSRR